MLSNSIKMLDKAKNEKYAIPQFNINNLKWAKYILEISQNLKSPVILGVSENAIKYIGGYNTVVNMIKGLIKDLNITVPVSLHLDHGKSVQSCINAINAGFTSVMIDGSKFSLNENINMTNEVIKYAKEYNVSVEAEIENIDDNYDNNSYSKLQDIIEFINKTDINSFAPSIGNAHGIYKNEPKLELNLLKQINENVDIPLVLHGGSGIDDEQIRKVIKLGISKININTQLQVEWSKQVRIFLNKNKNVYDPKEIINSGKDAIQKKVMEYIILFGSNNKY